MMFSFYQIICNCILLYFPNFIKEGQNLQDQLFYTVFSFNRWSVKNGKYSLSNLINLIKLSIAKSRNLMKQNTNHQSIIELAKPNFSKTKKLCIIKPFSKQKVTQSFKKSQVNFQFATSDLKTQRLIAKQQPETYSRLSQLRVRTEADSHHKNKNIFSSHYLVNILPGSINPIQDYIQINNSKIKRNQFRGPVYNSQRSFHHEENPQSTIQPLQVKEEIYKTHRNPRQLKFKVGLKKNNQLNTSNQSTYHPQRHSPFNKSLARVLITQLKTEQSQTIGSGIYSQSIPRSIPPKLSFNSSSNQFITNQIINQKSKTSQIPKLSQKSNLFKSIQIFQKKQTLLGQLESEKGIQEKYGKRIFQFLVRDRFQEIERKQNFVLKFKTEAEQNQRQIIKNKFIINIEKGKYEAKLKYEKRPVNLKIKGKTSRLVTED